MAAIADHVNPMLGKAGGAAGAGVPASGRDAVAVSVADAGAKAQDATRRRRRRVTVCAAVCAVVLAAAALAIGLGVGLGLQPGSESTDDDSAQAGCPAAPVVIALGASADVGVALAAASVQAALVADVAAAAGLTADEVGIAALVAQDGSDIAIDGSYEVGVVAGSGSAPAQLPAGQNGALLLLVPGGAACAALDAAAARADADQAAQAVNATFTAGAAPADTFPSLLPALAAVSANAAVLAPGDVTFTALPAAAAAVRGPRVSPSPSPSAAAAGGAGPSASPSPAAGGADHSPSPTAAGGADPSPSPAASGGPSASPSPAAGGADPSPSPAAGGGPSASPSPAAGGADPSPSPAAGGGPGPNVDPTPSPSPASSGSPSANADPTPSPTTASSGSPSPSADPSPSSSVTSTASGSASLTSTPSISVTASRSASATGSASITATESRSASATSSASITASASITGTVSASPSPASPSSSHTASRSASATISPSPTASISPCPAPAQAANAACMPARSFPAFGYGGYGSVVFHVSPGDNATLYAGGYTDLPEVVAPPNKPPMTSMEFTLQAGERRCSSRKLIWDAQQVGPSGSIYGSIWDEAAQQRFIVGAFDEMVDPTFNPVSQEVADAMGGRVARAIIWNAASGTWTTPSDGTHAGVSDTVYALANITGLGYVLGGRFRRLRFDTATSGSDSSFEDEDAEVNGIAVWNGTWSGLPEGGPQGGPVLALLADGAGTPGTFIAGGYFTYYFPPVGSSQNIRKVARYTAGSGWTQLGDGLNNGVEAMAWWNGKLVIGGTFTTSAATPGVELGSVAQLDSGTNRWQAVGSGADIGSKFNGNSEMGTSALLVPPSGTYAGCLVAGGQYPEGLASGLGATGGVSVMAFCGTAWEVVGAGWLSSNDGTDSVPRVYSLAMWGGDILAGGRMGWIGAFDRSVYFGGVAIRNEASGAWRGLGTDSDAPMCGLRGSFGSVLSGDNAVNSVALPDGSLLLYGALLSASNLVDIGYGLMRYDGARLRMLSPRYRSQEFIWVSQAVSYFAEMTRDVNYASGPGDVHAVVAPLSADAPHTGVPERWLILRKDTVAVHAWDPDTGSTDMLVMPQGLVYLWDAAEPNPRQMDSHSGGGPRDVFTATWLGSSGVNSSRVFLGGSFRAVEKDPGNAYNPIPLAMNLVIWDFDAGVYDVVAQADYDATDGYPAMGVWGEVAGSPAAVTASVWLPPPGGAPGGGKVVFGGTFTNFYPGASNEAVLAAKDPSAGANWAKHLRLLAPYVAAWDTDSRTFELLEDAATGEVGPARFNLVPISDRAGVYTMTLRDGSIFVGGTFTKFMKRDGSLGTRAFNNVARWDFAARTWNTLADVGAGSAGVGFGMPLCECDTDDTLNRVRGITFGPDGKLYATGSFRSMPAGDDRPLYGVAVWSVATGGTWANATWGTAHPVGAASRYDTDESASVAGIAWYGSSQLVLTGSFSRALNNAAGPTAEGWLTPRAAVYRK